MGGQLWRVQSAAQLTFFLTEEQSMRSSLIRTRSAEPSSTWVDAHSWRVLGASESSVGQSDDNDLDGLVGFLRVTPLLWLILDEGATGKISAEGAADNEAHLVQAALDFLGEPSDSFKVIGSQGDAGLGGLTHGLCTFRGVGTGQFHTLSDVCFAQSGQTVTLRAGLTAGWLGLPIAKGDGLEPGPILHVVRLLEAHGIIVLRLPDDVDANTAAPTSTSPHRATPAGRVLLRDVATGMRSRNMHEQRSRISA
jgi:hypothetical protein